MNTKITFTRFLFSLVLMLSAVGVSAPTALAAKPTKTDFTFNMSDVLTDVCSFPVNIVATGSGFDTEFFDSSGVLVRIYEHISERDTYTANGKTLVGLPFTFNIEYLLDSSGTMTNILADGIVEKIPLPDGSLFISAGRLDFTAHPGASFILTPDKGHSGNLAAFCAALSS